MQCEFCQAELGENDVVCPECGKPVAHEIEGFENAVLIQQTLKTIIDEYGREAVEDTHRFIALLKDYLPEYDKERRLLINSLLAGSLKFMLDETDSGIGITRTRSCVLSECYVTEEAADFVAICFAYMLGIVYDASVIAEHINNAEKAAEEEDEGDAPAQSGAPLKINSKVFQTANAARFRISGNVTIPEGYTKIDSFCFNGFGFMRTLKLPNTLMAIGEYSLSECKRLKGVDLPASLKKIGRGAFSQCSKLAVIKIPQGVLEIEDDTFSFCESLEVVEIPDTVSSIGAQAFSGCDKLRKLFLPESVKYIDNNAFTYCPELTIRCYENSYVHKYCLKNEITVETVVKGAELTAKMIEEG